ncbi:MAG: GPP34 family phosphoprotein [Planctomycetota bacterium]|nr:GPP34 family phosphoprotein [Planctomycetota bacterium]
MPGTPLTLQEEVLLISLNDRTGKFHRGVNWVYALNAAALAELLLCERIVLAEDRVQVKRTTPVGDAALDVALCRLAMGRRANSLPAWVQSLYRDRRLPFEVLTTRMVLRGILTIEQARVLWVFRQEVYPTQNPVPEEHVVRRIREAVLVETAAVDERTAVLIAVLNGARALGIVLTEAETKQSKRRVQEICASTAAGAAVGKAIADAIAAEQAAASAAAVAGAVSAASC